MKKEKNVCELHDETQTLVLSKKYESGPTPAEGLGVPGVCGKQPESGAEAESRALSGLGGLPQRGRGGFEGSDRPVSRRAAHHSREKVGKLSALKKLRYVLGEGL